MESTIDKVRQRTRLAVYSTAAASAAAIAQLGMGAVVTSTGPGPVWSGSRTGTGSGALTNLNWGDAVLNNKLVARIEYGQYGAAGGAIAGYQFRRGWIDVGNGNIVGGPLASGATIGAGLAWTGQYRGANGLSLASSAGPGATWVPYGGGSWLLGSATGPASLRGFMAFRIKSGSSDYYYGYFDVEYSRTGDVIGSTYTMTVHGWAYESTLNQSITIGGASGVPGGAGLAALAFGAAGLRGRRRSRN